MKQQSVYVYTNVRTFLVQTAHQDQELKQRDVVKMLRILDCKSYVQRVTPKEETGLFSVTLKEDYAEKKKEIIEKIKKNKDLDFNYVPPPHSEERQEIILTGVPEELRANTIRSYMGIYVTSPEVTFLMLEDDDEDCDGMESGEVRVTHSGLKQVLPQYVKVAQGTRAFVKSTSQIPWDKMLLKCSNCLGNGHLRFECSNEQKCYKCRRSGHVAQECVPCTFCKRFGHTEDVCRNKLKKKKEEKPSNEIKREDTKKDKQMFVKHLPPARSEYRVPQRPITKTETKEGQLTQRYY